MDLLYYIVTAYFWSKSPEHDQYIWESLSGLHNMVLFFSFINMLTRVSLLSTFFRELLLEYCSWAPNQINNRSWEEGCKELIELTFSYLSVIEMWTISRYYSKEGIGETCRVKAFDFINGFGN